MTSERGNRVSDRSELFGIDCPPITRAAGFPHRRVARKVQSSCASPPRCGHNRTRAQVGTLTITCTGRFDLIHETQPSHSAACYQSDVVSRDFELTPVESTTDSNVDSQRLRSPPRARRVRCIRDLVDLRARLLKGLRFRSGLRAALAAELSWTHVRPASKRANETLLRREPERTPDLLDRVATVK